MNGAKKSIKGKRALVIGGGIAGLAAASVLARHFEAVTVVERDPYPASPEVRPHTPQGAHVHILLAGGLLSLTRLVPELPAWLDEMGLEQRDLTEHVRVANGPAWLPKVRSGVPIRPCTRPVLEHLLLRHARSTPNITTLDDAKVGALLGGQRARGAKVTRAGVTEDIEADLVLDTAGRSSPSPKWLAEAGIGPIEEEVVDAGVVYSSCWFEPPGDIDDDWTLLGLAPRVPDEPNSGAVMRVSQGRVLAAFIGYGKPKPPRDAAEFVNRFEALGVPEPGRLLRASKPIGDVSNYANTQNRFRHYGRLSSFVDRLVVLGDSLCALNPRYGQGMTVAALSVEELDRQLDEHFRERGSLDGFSVRFHRKMESVLSLPWQMALMEDKLWVNVFAGREPGLLGRLTAQASTRILVSVFADIDAYVQFMRVAHMLDAPTKLLSGKVLTAILRGGAGAQAAEPPRIGSGTRAAAPAAAELASQRTNRDVDGAP